MELTGEEEQMPGIGSLEEKILVSVRLRPLSEKELARNDILDWECLSDNTIVYRNSLSISERSMYPTAYTFDRVFSSDSPTRQVYEEGAKEVALSVVNGINASVFAYGQTSSGKTYTMTGITDYALADMYEYIDRHKEREFTLKFSAMEIYNECVRDLLSADSTSLRLLDDPEKGTVVEKLTEETLRDWNHFKELLSICEAQRQIGETALNEASSRSHQILRLTIESFPCELSGNDKLSTLTASVNFVDLAGSERTSQTLSAGTRLKEGCHINRSLLTLGTVIRKLSKGKNGHIPFRDSKLTRILQSSLGGNARTAIICTMSPARTHVEQSRNTLLFASCAKEVTTNAQVNVVMSDKALVKHLQRELSRLESELRNSGQTFITSELAALLREKDLEIEKLKKEIMELTVQRDLAWSEVEDLQQMGRDDKQSTEWVGMDHHYPKLRVRSSWDSSNAILESPIVGEPFCQDAGIRSASTSPHSDEHSPTSSDENLFQLPDFRMNFLCTNSQHLSIRVPGFIEGDVHQEEIEEKPDKILEDNCRELQCIEVELSTNRYTTSNMSECSPDRYEDLSISLSEAHPAKSGSTEFESEDTAKQEFRTGQLPLKEEKESNRTAPDFVIPSPEKPSPPKSSPWLFEKDIPSSRCLKLMRSSSCKARLMTSSSSPWFEGEKMNENTPPSWFEKDFPGRPEGNQRKLSVLNYDAENARLSRNGSQTSASNVSDCKVEAQKVTSSNDGNSMDLNNLVGDLKEVTNLQCEKQLVDHAEVEGKWCNVSAKNVKDVGLDPIQDGLATPSMWPLEFRRVQREIIELWHSCNISLAHRTYFFLLFKGDPKDSIYMEVELRRLSFIKNTFSQGKRTSEDGRVLTLTSSLRQLARERQRLSQQMRKKLSKEDRENLFLRWGIGLNTKHRRMRLAQRLWSGTKDMEHIKESAAVVAKLIGFTDSGQGTKEMFGLNFAPRSKTKKHASWKRSVMSLSIL